MGNKKGGPAIGPPQSLGACTGASLIQNALNGGTNSFIRSMNAAHPAARAALAFEHLFTGALNAASASLILLGIFYPADELISP